MSDTRIAVFSDVHGNAAALDAVLEDIDRQGVDARYCGGDLLGLGPRPNEVVARVREREIPTILGNHEVEVLAQHDGDRPTDKDHIIWTDSVLRKRHRRWLRTLPGHLDIDLGGLRCLLVHGSPRNTYDYVFASITARSIEAFFPEGVPRPDVLVAGHTHIPFARRVGGMLVVNCGSAGKPVDGDPRVAWALVEARAGRARARIRRVKYDVEETLAAMRKVKMRKGLVKALQGAMRRPPPRRVGEVS